MVIESTSAFFTGGAVYIGDNVRAIVNRVYIRQSTAIAGNGGGGVFLSTLGSYVALSMPRSDGLARLTVCVCCGVRCRLSTITDLHVVDGVANFGHGGGLLMSDIGADGPTLPALTFVAATRCRATQNGGGIALNSVRFMRMEDFTVTDCFANKAAGGGMSVVAASALALTRGTITGCSALTSGAGALFSDVGLSTFTNLNVTNNGNAQVRGGGIAVSGGTMFDIVNCTLRLGALPARCLSLTRAIATPVLACRLPSYLRREQSTHRRRSVCLCWLPGPECLRRALQQRRVRRRRWHQRAGRRVGGRVGTGPQPQLCATGWRAWRYRRGSKARPWCVQPSCLPV